MQRLRRILLAALATLPLMATTAAGTYPDITVNPPTDRLEARQKLLDFVCTVTLSDCTGLAPPKVEYVQLDWVSPYVAGLYYPFGDTIYIDVDYRDGWPHPALMGVLVHEMAHYVYDHVQHPEYTGEEDGGCATEAFAWHVANSFYLWVGLPEYVDYKWYERYGCPAPGPVAVLR